MPAKASRRAIVAAAAALAVASTAWGHQEPADCTSSGIALRVSAFRADGVTPLRGAGSECEQIVFRAALQTADPSSCAVSGGTLTLRTPDGVVHALVDPLPCIGGRTAADAARPSCTATSVDGGIVPYAVREADVVDGVVSALARYEHGVTHDGATDTEGVAAESHRRAAVTSCNDADPCTRDACDPTKPGAAACSYSPLCDDDDPTTADTCDAGRCYFVPIASTARLTCGASQDGR